MKFITCLLFILPVMSWCQSLDGSGTSVVNPPRTLVGSPEAIEAGVNSVFQQGNKFKKDKPVKLFEWFSYKTDSTYRVRREYSAEEFYSDERMVLIPAKEAHYPFLVEHLGKRITFKKETLRYKVFVYHGDTKIYDTDGLLMATIRFHLGRPKIIYINHYYQNGQLQFVREIKSAGPGEPMINTGVLEAYYPDGSVFEQPLTEDGTAIILLDETGKPEDTCECIGQNIMEWGEAYLYSFIDKFYFLLEDIYGKEKMDCCWE